MRSVAVACLMSEFTRPVPSISLGSHNPALRSSQLLAHDRLMSATTGAPPVLSTRYIV